MGSWPLACGGVSGGLPVRHSGALPDTAHRMGQDRVRRDFRSWELFSEQSGPIAGSGPAGFRVIDVVD